MLRFLIVLFIFPFASAWKGKAPLLATHKSIAAASICAAAACFSIYTPTSVHAENAALSGAVSAMMDKSDKGLVEDTRPFDQLPEAAKKRRALTYCKDTDKRKAAGYPTATACTEAVLKGNFAVAFPSDSFSNSKILQKVNAGQSLSTNSAAGRGGATRVAGPGGANDGPRREKVLDLSDLNPAAKKRRATAGCRKPEVRKYARMASESQCTNTVLSGDFDGVIDALEYGY